jgi:uncharacterized protein (TIGR00369 family)
MSLPSPPDPEFRNRILDSFSRQPFMTLVAAEMNHIEAGETEVRLPYRADLTQQHGLFHGGLIGTLADVAGVYAAYTLMPASHSLLTVEFKVSFLRPALSGMLVARGRVIKPGRSLTTSQSDIYCETGGKVTHCATAIITMMALAEQSDIPTTSQC